MSHKWKKGDKFTIDLVKSEDLGYYTDGYGNNETVHRVKGFSDITEETVIKFIDLDGDNNCISAEACIPFIEQKQNKRPLRYDYRVGKW